jgi:diacylglycerol O-acyltransferase
VESIPLSREDLAILALESDTVAGHTCKVVWIGGSAPDEAALRASIDERIAAAPLLTRRLGGAEDAPAWVPDDAFDISRHVGMAPVDGPIDRDRVPAVVAALFEQRLDRARPLWRLDLLPLRGGGAVLAWRLHHAIADGTTAVRYAAEVLWDPEPAPAAGPGDRAHAHAVDDERRRGHLTGFLEREFVRAPDASPFDQRIGRLRRVAFASVPLKRLHDAARELGGATVNDAVLTTVAGGIRRWIEHHHGPLGAIRVKVPVSLHHEGEDAANRDSFFSVEIPLGEPDPVVRLRQVREATAVRKTEHDAETMDEILRGLSRVSPRLARFCERVETNPRSFALNVSNVPGPRRPVSVQGAPVEHLHTIAEIGERHALRVSALSLADQLGFGLCADPAIVDDLDAMRGGFEAEAAALIAAAGG